MVEKLRADAGRKQEVSVLTQKFRQTDEPPAPAKKKTVVIAVDGPAASGKGTLAKAIAAQLGYAYLDTGALYRAVAFETLQAGGDPSKIEDVQKVLKDVKKKLSPEYLSDPVLRTPPVAEASARVAALQDVRKAVRNYQTSFAKNPPGGEPGAVLDGRDIGTVVCPGADVKLFITADAQERAKRRFLELKGRVPGLTLETVLDDINRRDQNDMNRQHSPLKAADDAHILDTTQLDRQQALDAALQIVASKINPPAGGKDLKRGI